MLVHKSLFEFLYGVYGCDYFIQAKHSHRNTSILSSNRRATTVGNTARGDSQSVTRAETTGSHSKQYSAANTNNNLHFQLLKTKDLGSQTSSLTGTSSVNDLGNAQRSRENSKIPKKEEKKQT